MKSKYEQLVKDGNEVNKHLSTKRCNLGQISLIAGIVIIISQCFILHFWSMGLKDETIKDLNKRNELSDNKAEIMTLEIEIQEIQTRNSALHDKIKTGRFSIGNLEEHLDVLKENKKKIIAKLESKRHYSAVSKAMSTILSPSFLERVEQITNCTFYTLCYRSSRDGLSSKAFHEKCDGLTPTVTLIQSSDDMVFGGFTRESWSESKLKHDPTALLFSLKNDVIYSIKKDMPAINTSPKTLTIFGQNDIVVTESHCYTRSVLISYQSSPDYDLDPYDDIDAEKNYFLLKELEVFQMKYRNN